MKHEMSTLLARPAGPHAEVTELGDAPALPRLAPGIARAMSRLYSGCGPLAFELRGAACVLRFVLRHRPVPTMDSCRFMLGPHAGVVGVDVPAAAHLLGERRVDLLPPELRCVLWADALHPLSQAIERATRLRFEWTLAAAHDDAMQFDPRRALCFELESGGTLHSGFVQFDDASAPEALLPILPLPRADRTRPLDGLRMPLRFLVGTTRIALREVAGVRAGDIVGIEHWNAAGAGVQLTADFAAARLQLLARAEGEQITILDTKDLAMDIDSPGNADATPLPLDRLDALEVALRFELGDLSLTLGELKSLQAGHVFELPQPLNRSPVRILAHGNLLGKGHLVAVGDRLGVRVAEFAPGEI
jgi:type III secretion protein Q